MSRRIGAELERNGIEVLYTRSQDEFISLAGRTQLANDSRADLFISVHANASKDKGARGPETYFVSLDASDDEAPPAPSGPEPVEGPYGSTVIIRRATGPRAC